MQKNITVKAVLLDMDGTLADSLSVMRTVYDRFMTRFCVLPTEEEFESLNGPPLKKIVSILKDKHGLSESIESLLTLYNQFIDEAYDTVQPHEGAPELLRHAQQQGWKIGLVTSNNRPRAEHWLATVNLASYFDLLITGEDVSKGKPDPEPYLLAAERLDILPAQIIAVEDSVQGVQSAVTAGMRVFGLNVTAKGAKKIPSLKTLTEYALNT